MAAALVALIGVSLFFGLRSVNSWRVEKRAAAVRVDVLARERNIVSWVLADVERHAAQRDEATVADIEAHLTLLDLNWDAVHDGGPELSYELEPTGRSVPAWPGLDTRFAAVHTALADYEEELRAFLATSDPSTLAALRHHAEELATAIDEVAAAAAEETLDDTRLWQAAACLVIAVGPLLTLTAWGFVRRRRAIRLRETALAESRASEERYRALIDELPIPVVIHGASGVLQANDAAAALVGVPSPSDLLGVDVNRFLVPGSPEPTHRAVHYEQHGDDAHQYRVRARLAAGERVLQMYRRAIPFQGEVVAMMAAIDVTDGAHAQAELADLENTQRAILEQLNEGVILHRPGERIIRANRAAQEMLGVCEGQGDLATQAAHFSMFEPDGTPVPAHDTPTQRALRTGEPQRDRLIQLRPETGRARWMKVDSVAMGSPEDPLVLVTFADVTTAKGTDLALAENEMIQRIILDSLDEGVVLHGLDVGVISANRSATERLGITKGPELFPVQLTRRVESFENGAPLDLDDTPTLRALRSGEAQRGRILEYRGQDGQSMWVQVDSCPLPVPIGGSAAPVLLTMVDITAQHIAAQNLAISERRLRLLIENTRELITVVGMDGLIKFVSPSCQDILGYKPSAALGRPLADYLHDDDYRPVVKAVLSGTHGDSVLVRARHADGSIRWLEALPHTLTDEQGQPNGVLLSSRDITERLDIEQQLDAERRLLNATFASVHAGILAVDGTGRVIQANDGYCQLVGRQIDVGDQLTTDLPYHLMDRDGIELPLDTRPIPAALRGHVVVDQPVQLVRNDGRRFDLLASASPIYSKGEVCGAVLTVHDVTPLRAAERELRDLASVDPLTGLRNRRKILEDLDASLRNSVGMPRNLAVLFVDLDDFKAVNDSLGHDAGDELLVAVAERLNDSVRTGDIVGRYGGDEFIVIMEPGAESDVHRLVDRIETELASPFILSGGVIQCGGSIGIAWHRPGQTSHDLLASADAAMYERKRNRKLHPSQ